MNQNCLTKMREIYAEYSGMEIAEAIRVIRAELTKEEDRHTLQVEILAKQAVLDKLTQIK